MPTSDGRWREKNAKKLFSKYLNQTISELYTDDNKSKYSSNPIDIFKSAKKEEKSYEKLYTKETTSKAPTTEFLCKISNRKKIFNEQFNLCEAKISLEEIIKSINSQRNYKSPGNDGLTAEFYKHFSNGLVSVLLNVYNYWGKLFTMAWVFLLEQESYLSQIKRW